jgi:carbon starvation protein
MKAIYLVALGLGAFVFGYRVYSRYIAEKIFRLDPDFKTPAHEFRDDVDFIPTDRRVLFGHHFTSVAGAAPIVGPAIAVIWGWLPAFLWVVIGTVAAGAVHDFATIWISVRHKARSMCNLTTHIIGARSKWLFLLVVFILLTMVNAVFALLISTLFVQNPGAVLPVWIQMPIAMTVGYLIYRRGNKLLVPSLTALVLLYVFVALGWQFQDHVYGTVLPTVMRDSNVPWIVVMLAYCFLASSLPIWFLLQPRDYINAHQLLLALGVIFLGVLVLNPTVQAPAINSADTGSPSLIPFLFITVACGAISGFHGLVGSGTTSKQLAAETDARYVGYLGTLGEGSLALTSIVVCTAGFATFDLWKEHYASWGNAASGGLTAYVNGVAVMAGGVGIPLELGKVFASVVVICFAATSLDSSVRIQKYILNEFGEDFGISPLRNTWVASLVAVLLSGLLALHDGVGRGGMVLWPLFGTSNQLLAGLSLLVVTLYLRRLDRPSWITLVPMGFMLAMTTWAMVVQLFDHIQHGRAFLILMGSVILFCELWLIAEALTVVRNGRRNAVPENA